MGLFEGLQDAMFATVTTTFGTAATRNPSNALVDPENPGAVQLAITADVLFKNPSEVATVFGIEYQPETVYIEFKRSDFEGLKELVDAKKPEPMVVKGAAYWVKRILSKWDGESLVAELIPEE